MAETNRDVIYTLRVATDPAAKKALDDWGRQITTLENKLAEETRKKATERQNEDNKVFQNRLKMLDRIAKDEQKKRDEAAKADQQAIAKAEAATARATETIRSSKEQMRNMFNQGTDGLLKLGRGFALLGTAGEKDVQKLLENLVKIQATFDIIKGAVETYTAITESVRAYRAAVEAATAAETALSAARTRTAAAGGASLAGGAVSGAAGRVGGAAAGLGSIGVTGGAAAAAVIGVGAAAKVVSEQFIEASDKTKTFTYKIQDAYRSIGSFVAKLFGYESKLAKAAKRDEERRIDVQGGLRIGEAEDSLQFGLRDRVNESLTAGLSGRARSGRISQLEGQELAGIRRRLSSNAQGGETMTQAQRITLLERQAELARREVDFRKELLSQEKEIAREKIRAADEALRKTQQEIDLRQGIIDREQSRLLSAKERFGQLLPHEQARLARAKTRADAGAALSREESSALRGVGTGGALDAARSSDLSRADRSNFDSFFGEQERRNIATAQSQKSRLEIELRDTRDLKVKIEDNFDQTAELIASTITQRVAELNGALLQEVEAKLEKQKSDINSQTFNRLQQVRAANK